MNLTELYATRFPNGMGRTGSTVSVQANKPYMSLSLPPLDPQNPEHSLWEAYRTWVSAMPSSFIYTQPMWKSKWEGEYYVSGPILNGQNVEGPLPGVAFSSALHSETVFGEFLGSEKCLMLEVFRQPVPESDSREFSLEWEADESAFRTQDRLRRARRALLAVCENWLLGVLCLAGLALYMRKQGFDIESVIVSALLFLAILGAAVWAYRARSRRERAIKEANEFCHKLLVGFTELGERWSRSPD